MAEFFLHIIRYFCLHFYDHKLCKIERFAPVFLLDVYRLCFHMFRKPSETAELSRRSGFLENSDVVKKMEEASCGSDKRKKAEKKPRERSDKCKSLRKNKRKGFCGNAFIRSTGNNNELATKSTSTTSTPEEENHDVYNVSVMGKKIGEPLKTTPVKMLTRKRKRNSNVLSSNDICPADGYKIIDSSIFQSVLDTISKYTSCCIEKTLQLKQNNQKKRYVRDLDVIL